MARGTTTTKKRQVVATKKKKTTKEKKAATPPREDHPLENSLDDWVADQSPPPSSCMTCRHGEAAESLRVLLRAMIKHKARHITKRQLYSKVSKEHADYRAGYWAFRNHLYNHERVLWERAQGLETVDAIERLGDVVRDVATGGAER